MRRCGGRLRRRDAAADERDARGRAGGRVPRDSAQREPVGARLHHGGRGVRERGRHARALRDQPRRAARRPPRALVRPAGGGPAAPPRVQRGVGAGRRGADAERAAAQARRPARVRRRDLPRVRRAPLRAAPPKGRRRLPDSDAARDAGGRRRRWCGQPPARRRLEPVGPPRQRVRRRWRRRCERRWRRRRRDHFGAPGARRRGAGGARARVWAPRPPRLVPRALCAPPPDPRTPRGGRDAARPRRRRIRRRLADRRVRRVRCESDDSDATDMSCSRPRIGSSRRRMPRIAAAAAASPPRFAAASRVRADAGGRRLHASAGARRRPHARRAPVPGVRRHVYAKVESLNPTTSASTRSSCAPRITRTSRTL